MKLRIPIELFITLFLGISATAGDAKSPLPVSPPRPALCRAVPIGPSDIPLTIDVPGDYYLTADLPSSGIAISIKASNVKLDLMGFTISGTITGADPTHLTIVNGKFTGEDKAVDLQAASDITLESLTVNKDGVPAVLLGENAHLRDVSVNSHSISLICGNGCIVERGRFFANSISGVAIVVGTDSVLTDVTAAGGDGLAAGARTRVLKSDFDGYHNGIIADGALELTDSHAGASGDYAVLAGAGSRVVRSSAGGGIAYCVYLGPSSYVEELTVTAGALAFGLVIGDNGQVLHSRFTGSGRSIQVGSNTRVIGNTVFGLDGIGIAVGGVANTVEGNVVSGEAVAFQIGGPDNAVFKNAARGSSLKNYQIDSGNQVGPIEPMASSTSCWANASD